MFPIYQDIDRTKLIADKSRYGMANLFGIIAHTDANPNIKIVLRDTDYWYSFAYLHHKGLGINEVVSMYNPLHEADLSKFADVADSIVNGK